MLYSLHARWGPKGSAGLLGLMHRAGRAARAAWPLRKVLGEGERSGAARANVFVSWELRERLVNVESHAHAWASVRLAARNLGCKGGRGLISEPTAAGGVGMQGCGSEQGLGVAWGPAAERDHGKDHRFPRKLRTRGR